MSRFALVAVLALLLAACGGGGGNKNEGFLAGLRSNGVETSSPMPLPPGILDVSSTQYNVPGGVLHIFTFSTPAEAKAAAARVRPDGYMVRNLAGINQAVDWAAPPHWFRKGRGVAVYIGRSSDVIDALTKTAGAQFAGA
jgi:hypothetical protein